MSDFFYCFNPYDPKSLDEVKNFTTPFVNGYGDFSTPYYGLNDDKFLDEWKYPQFSYTFNSFGFRYSPLKYESDIGAFGCSYTFGQSLPNDFIWHSKLSEYTGLSVLNFGVAGVGIEHIIDIFCIVAKFIKMKKAIFLLPHYSRIHYGQLVNNSPTVVNALPIDKFYRYLFRGMSTEELQRRTKIALYRAEHIAKLYNIELYYSSYQYEVYDLLKLMNFSHAKILPEWNSSFEGSDTDKARDKHHPGPLHHEVWAKKIQPFIQ